jgi:DNA repair exonuclease SbcCD ATPase subunit
MSDAQLLFLSAVIAAVLSYIGNRASSTAHQRTSEAAVTKEAFDGLVETVKTLRTEVKEQIDLREQEAKHYNKALAEQKELREKEMDAYRKALANIEARFESEREKYRRFISALLSQLKEADMIPVVEWDTDDDYLVSK